MRNTTFLLMAFQPSRKYLWGCLWLFQARETRFCTCVLAFLSVFLALLCSQEIASCNLSVLFYYSIWRMQLQQGSSYNTILSHEFSTRTIEGNQFIAQVTSVCMEDLLRLSLYWRSFKRPCLKQHTYFQKKKMSVWSTGFSIFFLIIT